jgi:hypothetical protein
MVDKKTAMSSWCLAPLSRPFKKNSIEILVPTVHFDRSLLWTRKLHFYVFAFTLEIARTEHDEHSV